jgi:hypothetical protein
VLPFGILDAIETTVEGQSNLVTWIMVRGILLGILLGAGLIELMVVVVVVVVVESESESIILSLAKRWDTEMDEQERHAVAFWGFEHS